MHIKPEVSWFPSPRECSSHFTHSGMLSSTLGISILTICPCQMFPLTLRFLVLTAGWIYSSLSYVDFPISVHVTVKPSWNQLYQLFSLPLADTLSYHCLPITQLKDLGVTCGSFLPFSTHIHQDLTILLLVHFFTLFFQSVSYCSALFIYSFIFNFCRSSLHTATWVMDLRYKTDCSSTHGIKSRPLRWHKKAFMTWHWLGTHCPYLMVQQYGEASGSLHTTDCLCLHGFLFFF